MNYQFVDKKGKHRYDSLLNARNAAEKACIELKQNISLSECGTGKVKWIFNYIEETKSAKVSLPGT